MLGGRPSLRAGIRAMSGSAPPRVLVRHVIRNTYLRVGLQLGIGTICLLAVFSTPKVWNALSLDPVLANPSLILMLFALVVLLNFGTGLAPLQLAAENLGGGLLGGCLGLGVIYLALLANGGSASNTITKAAVTLVLSGLFIFILTLYRFKYRQYVLFFIMASLTLAIDASASYHQTAKQYKFTLYWWAFGAIAGVAALLCTTLVFPVPAGAKVRQALAKALRLEGQLVAGVVGLMTGEVNEETGLLAAATGETGKRIGIDSGLYEQVLPIYNQATGAGAAIQTAWRYLGPAQLELDVYRRQHRFPKEPYRLLATLSRSMLSASMMLLYPVQTGRMRCTLCRLQRDPLLRLAAAFQGCCAAVAEVLEHNAPLGEAVEELGRMEEAFGALAASARGSGREAGALFTQSRLALDMALSLLFTACTRLRRMYLLLPGALGKDQPGAVAAVVAHYHSARNWDFHAMTQMPPSRANSLDLLRASLLDSGIGAAPKRTPSSQALALMAQPSLLVVPATEEGEGQGLLVRLRQGARLGWQRTGFSTHQLKLGLQMVVAYSIILIMVMITSVNNAVGGRMYWAVFICVAILEPSTGGVIFKALCRFVGTVLGGAAGLGATYLVYLCNGLSYHNHPQKFIIMTASLGVLAGGGAAAAVRFPRYAYVFIIYTIILCVIALPGYTTTSPMPIMALWRLVTTAIGIGVEVLVAIVVFPVTARDLFAETMASSLEQLADIADAAFHSVLPRSSRKQQLLPGRFTPAKNLPVGMNGASIRRREAQQAQQQQQQAQEQAQQQQARQAQQQQEQAQEQARQQQATPLSRMATSSRSSPAATATAAAAAAAAASGAAGTASAAAGAASAAAGTASGAAGTASGAAGTASAAAGTASAAAGTAGSSRILEPAVIEMAQRGKSMLGAAHHAQHAQHGAFSGKGSWDLPLAYPVVELEESSSQEQQVSPREGQQPSTLSESPGQRQRALHPESALDLQSRQGSGQLSTDGSGPPPAPHVIIAVPSPPAGTTSGKGAAPRWGAHAGPAGSGSREGSVHGGAVLGLGAPHLGLTGTGSSSREGSAHGGVQGAKMTLEAPMWGPSGNEQQGLQRKSGQALANGSSSEALEPFEAERGGLGRAPAGGASSGNGWGRVGSYPYRNSSGGVQGLQLSMQSMQSTQSPRRLRPNSNPHALPAAGTAASAAAGTAAAAAAGTAAAAAAADVEAGALDGVGGEEGRVDRTLSGVSLGQSSVGGQSVYAPLGGTSERIFGRVYARILPEGLQVGAAIVTLLQLDSALKFEWYPFRRPHRFPLEPGYRAQRLCRHMLNVLVAFAITLDSQDTQEVPALAPHARRVDALIRQLQECLRSFAGLVRGHVDVGSVVDLVASLDQHAARLFLAVVLGGAGGEAGGLSEPELVQGLAFVALMFNSAYVARLLCIALVQTFCAERPADLAQVNTLLGDPTRWSVDESLMLVATGVMGVAIGGTASSPETPRRGSLEPPAASPTGELAWERPAATQAAAATVI